MTAAASVQPLISMLYSAASVLIESVTDPEAIAAAPLRHRVAALSAVSRLIATLHKHSASFGDVLDLHTVPQPAVPSSEPLAPPVPTPDHAAPEPAVQNSQPTEPHSPSTLDYYDGWMTEEETQEVERMSRLAAQAYADGAIYAGRFLDPANDPALRLTMRPVPVRTR